MRLGIGSLEADTVSQVQPQTQTEPANNGLFPSDQSIPPLDDGSVSFTELSNFLLDTQYVQMDRIISFQDSFMYE